MPVDRPCAYGSRSDSTHQGRDSPRYDYFLGSSHNFRTSPHRALTPPHGTWDSPSQVSCSPEWPLLVRSSAESAPRLHCTAEMSEMETFEPAFRGTVASVVLDGTARTAAFGLEVEDAGSRGRHHSSDFVGRTDNSRDGRRADEPLGSPLGAPETPDGPVDTEPAVREPWRAAGIFRELLHIADFTTTPWHLNEMELWFAACNCLVTPLFGDTGAGRRYCQDCLRLAPLAHQT